MHHLEYDYINPLYGNINKELYNRLEEDKVTIDYYKTQILPNIEHYHRAVKTLASFEKRISENNNYSQVISSIKAKIESSKNKLFRHILELKNGYFYICQPYFEYGEGEKYATVPKISNTHGYLRNHATGIQNSNLLPELAILKIKYNKSIN